MREIRFKGNNMESSTLNPRKYLNPFLILIFFGLFFPKNLIHAYTSRVDVIVSDFNGAEKNNFTTNDSTLSAKFKVYYCAHENFSNGLYESILEIFDPSGKKVKTIIKEKLPLPQGSCHILECNFPNIPILFFTKSGSYKLKATTKEFYPNRPTPMVSFGRTQINIKDFGFSSSIFSAGINLLSPANEAQINSYRPYFQWIPGVSTKKYSISVSQNPNPELSPIWSLKGTSENFIQYPNNARALEPGKKYYWQITGLDLANRPVGSNYGKSKVFQFYIASGHSDKIKPIFPTNDEKINSELFQFEWEGIGGNHSYELNLGLDPDFENLIWTKTTSDNKIYFSLNAPDLIKGRKYFWQVKVFIQSREFKKLIISDVASFIFNKENQKVHSIAPLEKNDSGVFGKILDQIGNPSS